ncbi:MAG: type IV toxin-antitoxin system AbiEi family antitoxin domain-containing protein [Acidobacteriota bacterium]
MYKLEKLSGLEQKLYFLLEAENQKVVSAEKAMELLGISRMHAYNLLKNMRRKGALDRVKSNLFVRIPSHIVHDKGKYVEDPILVGKHLTKPYFFSYYSALYLHGLSQQPASHFHLSTTNHIQNVDYYGIVFHPVILTKKRFFGFKVIKYREENVFVSDLERTIVDVMNRPEYAGGYEEVIRSFQDMEKADWKRLLKYIDRMGEKILINRIGFVFDMLEEFIDVADEFLKELEKRLSDNIYYFEKNRKGAYIKKWKIIVDKRLENVIKGG